jgi:hypothetical protein
MSGAAYICLCSLQLPGINQYGFDQRRAEQ